MNPKIVFTLAALGIAGLFAGCSGPTYPMTYRIPIGTAQVTSSYGPQNLVVNGVQDVSCTPGAQLYYQVTSPVPITLYAFDKTSSVGPWNTLSQVQGVSAASSVLPTGSTVEFVFSAAQPGTGGTVILTVNNAPLTGTSMGTPASTTVTPSAQPPVTISPQSASVAVGQSVTFTASGGTGSGTYVWTGAANATGPGNVFTFNAPGTYSISVYRSSDGTYAQSNAATATVTVAAGTPSPSGYPSVTVTPAQ